MPERFEDAIEALRHIARGNGNVMRIADRIERAHEREVEVARSVGEMLRTGDVSRPITGELRDMVARFDNFNYVRKVSMDEADFDRLCDAIDVVHANLEAEYANVCEQLAEKDDAHEEHAKSIGSATVSVTPTISWTAVAESLRIVADLMEGAS